MQSEEEIDGEILNFFEKLYNGEEERKFGIEGLEWARICRETNESLERAFEEEEVKELFLNVMVIKRRGLTDS